MTCGAKNGTQVSKSRKKRNSLIAIATYSHLMLFTLCLLKMIRFYLSWIYNWFIDALHYVNNSLCAPKPFNGHYNGTQKIHFSSFLTFEISFSLSTFLLSQINSLMPFRSWPWQCTDTSPFQRLKIHNLHDMGYFLNSLLHHKRSCLHNLHISWLQLF